MEEPLSEYPRIRWRQSLIARVVALCAVLVVCLFGMVYELTRYYFHGMAEQMTMQTREMIDHIVFHLDEYSDGDFRELEKNLAGMYQGSTVELKPMEPGQKVAPFVLEPGPGGQITKVAHVAIPVAGRQLLLTVLAPLAPQTEIVRAFKNKYLLALAGVFVVALGMMVYFITRILRPLSDLASTCARISSGQLDGVEVRRGSGEIQALEYTFNRMVTSLREKEKIEANLRQAQRLSAIGNLAAGVAHDVRNPLNAIKLLSSHTIDTLEDVPEAGNAIRQLQTIRSEVNRLEEIVSSFLALAKERELQLEPSRIDSLLEECLHLVRKDAEARGVRLTSELRAGDTALLVDPKHLTRAILNVLINALEVCPRDGRVRLFSRATDTACEIEIRDDGPGMSKEVVERAFEPYFTTKNTGTGLGLSITRGIVEEHGGAVRLSSVPGQGSQVLITLPVQPPNK